MIRDPLYRKIVDGLKGPLDGELFEQCAADLLREYEPGLVPIRGGSDRGMDGAILDGDGSAYPLVATTQENVIGNLTWNLKRYLKVDGSRRKVQLATSRLLTTKRRQNLEKRAAELGFELVQIYDQAAMADRLYYAPHWCQELLNLAGDPPALSAVPESNRPWADQALVGRVRGSCLAARYFWRSSSAWSAGCRQDLSSAPDG